MVLEKKILFKSRLYGCRAYTKTRGLLETTKYLRKENAKLIEKVNNEMDPEKCQRLAKNNPSTVVYNDELIQSNMTNNVSVVAVSRDFFNYLADNLRNTSYPGVEHYTRYVVARLGLSPLVHVEPLIGEFGPVINDVLSFKYPISIPPCVIEDSSFDSSNRNVFIAVNSAPGNFDRREIIRQTWRNHLKDAHRERLLTTAGFTFTLGLTDDAETQEKIEEEAKTYGDIIQIGMEDFYKNLSMKMAGLFNWLYKYCNAKVDFVMKVDDDVYVNVRNLAHFVQDYYQSNLSVFGSSLQNNQHFSPQRGM
jgi:hypothetical protein